MRTTLELDDNVYESARKLAFEQRKSLGKVISELASKGLGQSDAPPQKRRLGFWEGKGRIADDFNETPPDIANAIEAEL